MWKVQGGLKNKSQDPKWRGYNKGLVPVICVL